MSTIAERHTRLHFKLKAEAAEMSQITGTNARTITATADRSVMQAENQVHKLFLKFAATISEPERNDFFDGRNRDLWQSTFARWLEEQAGKWGASND